MNWGLASQGGAHERGARGTGHTSVMRQTKITSAHEVITSAHEVMLFW
jgi:hypothetical protein